jgi:hypothetical protein
LGVEKHVGTERVHNDFGFFIPEVLLKIACYKVNLFLKAILLVFASCFSTYNFVASIMDTSAKTSVEASTHTREIIDCIFH